MSIELGRPSPPSKRQQAGQSARSSVFTAPHTPGFSSERLWASMERGLGGTAVIDAANGWPLGASASFRAGTAPTMAFGSTFGSTTSRLGSTGGLLSPRRAPAPPRTPPPRTAPLARHSRLGTAGSVRLGGTGADAGMPRGTPVFAGSLGQSPASRDRFSGPLSKVGA